MLKLHKCTNYNMSSIVIINNILYFGCDTFWFFSCDNLIYPNLE